MRKLLNAASAVLKVIRFDSKGPGPPFVRSVRSTTFKDYFCGQMTWAIQEIITDTKAKAEATLQRTAEVTKHAASAAVTVGDNAVLAAEVTASIIRPKVSLPAQVAQSNDAVPVLDDSDLILGRTDSYLEATNPAAAAPGAASVCLVAAAAAAAAAPVTVDHPHSLPPCRIRANKLIADAVACGADEVALAAATTEAVVEGLGTRLRMLICAEKRRLLENGVCNGGCFTTASKASGAGGDTLYSSIDDGICTLMAQLTAVLQSQLDVSKLIHHSIGVVQRIFRTAIPLLWGGQAQSLTRSVEATKATAETKARAVSATVDNAQNESEHHKVKRSIVHVIDGEMDVLCKYSHDAIMATLLSMIHFSDNMADVAVDDDDDDGVMVDPSDIVVFHPTDV
mmetsp:Transcript_5365/g.16271  ORF Transcript_5365/g.16271 Transcript_5365/m.16271 type:complete len:396 (-) Transcript_5365:99-1286(-)